MRIVPVLVLLSSSLLAQSADYEKLIKEYRSSPAGAEEFLTRFQAAAKEHAGTEAAVPYLIWIVENGGPHKQATLDALETLMDNHLESPRMGRVAERLPYMFPILGTQQTLLHLDYLTEVDDPEVQASARFARATFFTSMWGESAKDVDRKMSETDVAETVKLTKDEALKAKAAAMSFPARNLAIGDLAPDIFGMDIDGVPFKLSDYRGKVVVLDFWGDW